MGAGRTLMLGGARVDVTNAEAGRGLCISAASGSGKVEEGVLLIASKAGAMVRSHSPKDPLLASARMAKAFHHCFRRSRVSCGRGGWPAKLGLRSGRLTAVAAALAATVAIGPAVDAASASVFLTVTPKAVHRGHTVLIGGSAGSCPVGDTVTIISRAFPRTHEFAGVPAVLAKVRSAGHFRATTRIPLRRQVGRYGVTARCGGGNLGVEARLTVLR